MEIFNNYPHIEYVGSNLISVAPPYTEYTYDDVIGVFLKANLLNPIDSISTEFTVSILDNNLIANTASDISYRTVFINGVEFLKYSEYLFDNDSLLDLQDELREYKNKLLNDSSLLKNQAFLKDVDSIRAEIANFIMGEKLLKDVMNKSDNVFITVDNPTADYLIYDVNAMFHFKNYIVIVMNLINAYEYSLDTKDICLNEDIILDSGSVTLEILKGGFKA